MGSYEVEPKWGDELREDVKGDALPLWLWTPGKERTPGNGERETTLLQVGDFFLQFLSLIWCLFEYIVCLIAIFGWLLNLTGWFIFQVWRARSKLERGGGGPNEAAVQPASALQVHILYWFIPFLLVDIFFAPSILFAGATSVFGQKNSRRWALSRVDSQEPYFKKSYPPFDLKPSDENELVQNFESLTQMPNCPIQVANISLPLSSIQSMHCNDHNIRIFLLRKSLAASSSQCRLDISTLVSYQT